MRKLFEKKVKIFGREVSVFLIALIAVVGIVSAALIPYFAQITGLITVTQGLSVDGQGWGYEIEYSDTITSLEDKTVSSDDYSLINDAGVNAEVKFNTECSAIEEDSCDKIISTEMVELSVTGFEGGDDSFDRPYYKKTYYEPVGNADDLEELTYKFKITKNEFGVTNLAPYVVLKTADLVAVQMIPDGEVYETDEEYEKTIDGDTMFHTPVGSAITCTQADPCTLDTIKGAYSGDLTEISLAIGAWPGTHDKVISASMGISKINYAQAEHKLLVIGAGETIPFKISTYFPKAVKPDTYTITTKVEPVTA